MGLFVGFVVVLAPLSSSDELQTSVRALEHRYRRASTLKAAFFERNMEGNLGGIGCSSFFASLPNALRVRRHELEFAVLEEVNLGRR